MIEQLTNQGFNTNGDDTMVMANHENLSNNKRIDGTVIHNRITLNNAPGSKATEVGRERKEEFSEQPSYNHVDIDRQDQNSRSGAGLTI